MSFINFSFEHTPQYIFLYAVLLLLFLLDIQVLPIYLEVNVLMVLTLASIYYWSIYHPGLLPAWFLFCLGLLKDLITGLPFIGLSSIIFIAVHMMVKQQRLFLSGQNFFMLWAAYILVCMFASFVFWLFLCIYLNKIMPSSQYIIEGIIMVLAFPLILAITGPIHKLLPFASSDKASL